MSKTTNQYSPGVRERVVRMVLEHGGQHGSRRSAIVSIPGKLSCAAQTLNEWVKKADAESSRRAGVPTEMAAKLRTLERENRELRQARAARHAAAGLSSLTRGVADTARREAQARPAVHPAL